MYAGMKRRLDLTVELFSVHPPNLLKVSWQGKDSKKASSDKEKLISNLYYRFTLGDAEYSWYFLFP